MRRRLSAAIALLSLALSSCTQQAGPPARDPGKVVPAKTFSVPGRLYAVKSRALYRFSGARLQALLAGTRVKDPAVSADGTKLAYAKFGPQASTIVVSDASLSEAQPITPDTGAEGPLWAVSPAFTQDGSSLAYLTDQGKARSDPSHIHPNDLAVWRYDLARRQSERLTSPLPYTGGDSDPVWRPGSEGQLIFTRYAYEGDPPSPVARLTWLSAASGQAIYLSPGNARNFEPALSPDGRFVAFVHASPEGDDLYVMPLEPGFKAEPEPYPTESAVLIQSGIVAQPIWAPDGTAIAFLMLVKGSFDLYILPISTEPGIRAAGPPVAVTQGSFFDADSRLAWSP